MPGKDIDVAEIENLLITKAGRGVIVYSDATNCLVEGTTSPWTGISSNVAGASRKFLPTASSMAWLKFHYVSSTTYGPTGATLYVPAYRNLNTNTP